MQYAQVRAIENVSCQLMIHQENPGAFIAAERDHMRSVTFGVTDETRKGRLGHTRKTRMVSSLGAGPTFTQVCW